MKELLPEETVWRPEKEGDTIKGKVLKRFDTGFGVQLDIQTGEGKKISTPAHKVLQERIKNVKEGDIIEVEYRGSKPTKFGNDLQLYKAYDHTPAQGQGVLKDAS